MEYLWVFVLGYRPYSGSSSDKNSVTVVLSEELRNGLFDVNRCCDRLMWVKIEGVTTNLISAYTQSVCRAVDKEYFCQQIKDLLRAIPTAEGIFARWDLSGHAGRAAETCERVHGNFGYLTDL
ncbi:unnamed protein product [Euphydryas editha]|uniref:Uncharacterized protein n=1 Tax=Euphydryas editha TaxID=104508 RepID=A0AAU9TVH2_EUPED|nr:unnamed protein product [Euphydryas editha]